METSMGMNNWKSKFAVIWTGQLFSILSSYIAQFSVVLWIGMETGSATALAYAAIAGLLPQILLGPFAGVFIDRWSRKWTMIGADLFVAFCSAVIAVCFYLNVVEMWSLYILLMFRSVGSAFHAPAMKSAIPLLAPQSALVRVAGINEIIQSISMICGPILGAVFLLNFGMSAVMLLDVLGALIASTSLLFVSIPSVVKGSKSTKSVLYDMKEGALVIWRNRGMRWLMLSEVAVNFFVMPIVAVMPLMTLQYFKGSAYQVSLVEGVYGIGLLIGGVLLSIWSPKIRKSTLIICGLFGLGIVLAVCGVLPSTYFTVFVVLTIFQGLAVPLFTGPFTVLIQTQFASEYLGRVFALFGSVSQLPAMIGLLFAGFIADDIGVEKLFLFGGLVLAIIGIGLIFIPSVQQLEQKAL